MQSSDLYPMLFVLIPLFLGLLMLLIIFIAGFFLLLLTLGWQPHGGH